MLKFFVVIHSFGSYRTTNHSYRIRFLSTTRVRPCELLCESLSSFEPVSYKEVLDGTLSPDYLMGKLLYKCTYHICSFGGYNSVYGYMYLSDVIGQIVEVSLIEHVNVNGKETEKICLSLRNAE